MARANEQEDFIDHPSEDIIDLADERIEQPASPQIAVDAPSGPSSLARLKAVVGGWVFMIGGLALSIVALVVLLAVDIKRTEEEGKYVEQSSQLLMLSQRLAKDAREAVAGRSEAFVSLKESRDLFDKIVTVLRKGDAALGIPPTPDEFMHEEVLAADGKPGQVEGPLRLVIRTWAPAATEGLRNEVDQILAQEKTLFGTHEHVTAINQMSPQLLTTLDELVEQGQKAGMRQDFLNLVNRQQILSQRIAKNVNLYAQVGVEAVMAASEFSQDARFYRETEAKLKTTTPPSLRAKMDESVATFEQINVHIEGLLATAAELFVSQRSSQQIFDESDPLLAKARALVAAYIKLGDERAVFRAWAVVAGVASFIFMLMVGWKLVSEARTRERASMEQNRQTQDSILKLLDEMGDLADGDLSIQPEVTEQITGAIADSINYAVREMRNLVTRIKTAAAQVAVASEHSRQTATELTEAALRQAAQITETTERVKAMARSMADMSKSAEKSAEVAQGSLATAKRGSEAVQNTIRGMDEMREQIQETAKRIKRLGESSQQIGEIVELINDIAEQTNILSLNAAIQAAMAGEAGRGFAVVADEVQRLAERSAEATKQIADLVKTIQADTNEAVASMEQATNGVVETTRLADAAGRALGEIESVSEQLSSLIVSISRDAHRQSETATVVSTSMAKIQETTSLTSTGTRQTAESIGKLSDLARELQASVAGFKLPA
jgi:twitching motility protein PilJ